MERFSHSEQEKCPPAVMTFARSHSVSVLQHQLDVILNPDVRWLHFPSAFICEARLFGWFGECVVFLLDEVGRCWVRGSTYPWIQKLKKWLPASVFPPLSFRAWMGAETDSVLGFSPLINTFLWRKNRPVLTELIWKKLTNKKNLGVSTDKAVTPAVSSPYSCGERTARAEWGDTGGTRATLCFRQGCCMHDNNHTDSLRLWTSAV